MPDELARFCTDLRALLIARGQAALPEIAERLRILLVDPAFVAQTFDETMPPSQRVLHHDPETDAYVLAHVQAPGKRGMPHGHGPSWAIYGNARGVTEMTEWRRVNPAGEDHAVLAARERYQLGPGESRAYGPAAIHSTAHPETAWVIRVTGTDLNRLSRWRFDRSRDRIVEDEAVPADGESLGSRPKSTGPAELRNLAG
jgi:predicted metal-dependent enzyme (double-stranded beta helix superfamily)